MKIEKLKLPETTNKVALVSVAHADDLLLFCGGGVAALTESGWKVTVVRATNDRWDSFGLSESETIEANTKEFNLAMAHLGISRVIELNLDTDQLGTFTGEVERKSDPITTARNKCVVAMELSNCDLAIASEGSFGPHPSISFIPADDEFLLFIDKKYGSFTDFKKEFVQTALDLFGSGWVWLCYDNNGKLRLGPFPNQNNPHIEKCGIPLVGCDVWEHAYYLKYQNKRADYINNWWNLVNWKFVEERYNTFKF